MEETFVMMVRMFLRVGQLLNTFSTGNVCTQSWVSNIAETSNNTKIKPELVTLGNDIGKNQYLWISNVKQR